MMLMPYKFTNIFDKYVLIFHKLTVSVNFYEFNSLFFETFFTKQDLILNLKNSGKCL